MIVEAYENVSIQLPKRFHLPYFFTTNCHQCGKKLTADYLEDKYLLSPQTGKVQIEFICPICQIEQYEDAVLEITVSA